MAYNKVIYGGNVLIDLTKDTVTAQTLLSGTTAHDKSGDVITGVCAYDSDTSAATATEDEILAGKTAYVKGSMVTGKMQNRAAVSGTIASKAEKYTIPNGYHNGNGTVSISQTEQAKLIEGNIKSGVTILGVRGNYTGAAIAAQSLTVTPTVDGDEYLPGLGYQYFDSVTVNPIPYAEEENEQGGMTVKIATES